MAFGTYSSVLVGGSTELGGASGRSTTLVGGPLGTALAGGALGPALGGAVAGGESRAGAGAGAGGAAAAAVAVVKRVATANRFMTSWCGCARRSPSSITRCSPGRPRVQRRADGQSAG
jgi:hypothetical protein